MQPLQTCIGPNIRIGQESWCLLYVGFLFIKSIPEQDSREQSITADEEKNVKTNRQKHHINH